MGFLNSLGVGGGDPEGAVCHPGEDTAGSGKNDHPQAHPAGRPHRLDHVARAAAGADPDEHIPGPAQPLHLAGKHFFKRAVVRNGGQHRAVRRESDGRKRSAGIVPAQIVDHLPRKMLAIRRTAPVPAQKNLSPATETVRQQGPRLQQRPAAPPPRGSFHPQTLRKGPIHPSPRIPAPRRTDHPPCPATLARHG